MFPWKLKKKFVQMKKEMTFIDVRTLAEYNLFHIDGVIHLPEILAYPSAADNIDRNRPILFNYSVMAYHFHNTGLLSR